MPKTITVTIPSSQTDELVNRLRRQEKYSGLRVERKVSIDPPGDVLTIEATTRSHHDIVRLLSDVGIGHTAGSSITISEPSVMISVSSYQAVVNDSSELTWEEMELAIAKESNMTVNMIIVMFISGILAAIGLATNALHMVIAAMVIAPGFEPLTRISLGLVTSSGAFKRGLIHTLTGYLALIAGAALSALLFGTGGRAVFSVDASYLARGVLVSYWTNLSASSLAASAVASFGGVLLIISNRATLTAGAMIGLSLIPTAAIVGMTMVTGDMNLFSQGLLRWSIDAMLVLLFAAAAFIWKRFSLQKRGVMLKE